MSEVKEGIEIEVEEKLNRRVRYRVLDVDYPHQALRKIQDKKDLLRSIILSMTDAEVRVVYPETVRKFKFVEGLGEVE